MARFETILALPFLTCHKNPNLAVQRRVAFSRMVWKTESSSPGEVEITCKTSAVAFSRSTASSRSRRRRSDPLSARTVGALRRFGVAAFRRRDLTDAEPALERRRIAHPKGLGLRRFSKWDYSRDLRPAKWGSGVSLHGSNLEPLMSALGQKQTLEHARATSALPPKADIRRTRCDVR